jgi:DNA mismatch repair ATPase MutS
MSLINDAIQALSKFPDMQKAIRKLVSENKSLKAKVNQANQIQQLIKPLTHDSLSEEEKYRRLNKLVAEIKARKGK